MLLNFENIQKKYSLDVRGVLHIGAHYGQEYKIYERNNIKNIIFFEPCPDNFSVLEKNIGDKARLVNKALGNNNQKISMNIESANKGQSNSILKPVIHLIQYPHIKFESSIEVDMLKLDDYMLSENIDIFDYNMINIDVQGYELEVFKGGKNTLKNIDYIFTEVNRDNVYENNALVDEIDKFLSSYNFTRVETSWDGNTWGDAFYIKKR
jgi:FkbM family methyltransferase